MSEATEKNKGGRPRAEVDISVLTNLARIQCTAAECAKVLEVSEDTIDRRLKEEGYSGFAEFYKKHSEEGKASIRRAQFKLGVEQMNPTMLVWLGKQYLGQKDAPQRIEHGNPGDFDMSEYSDDELRQAASVARNGAGGTREKGTGTPSPDRLH